MQITIIGGAGFLGQKLAHSLIKAGRFGDRPITSLTLADLRAPTAPDTTFPVKTIACDITNVASVDALLTPETDVIFLLAAIVSGHAEADFEAGLRANLLGPMNILERVRALGTAPVLVFTSSIAVFGGAAPDPIQDWTAPNPQTSYGAQKAMVELLLNDYSRRGFVQGRGVRLPTISVRPGVPNRAASSFMSGVIREPLHGQPANCPVDPEFLHYYLSPHACVANLIRTAELDQGALGPQVNMTMPGRTWSMRQLIDAMTAVAGPEPATRITWKPEPEVARIVSGWRFDYRPEKALALGLKADESFEDNVRLFMADEGLGSPQTGKTGA